MAIAILIVLSHMGSNLVVSLAFLWGKAWTHKLLGRTYVDIYIWWVIRDHHLVVRDSGPPVAAGIQNAEEQSIKL